MQLVCTVCGGARCQR